MRFTVKGERKTYSVSSDIAVKESNKKGKITTLFSNGKVEIQFKKGNKEIVKLNEVR